MANDEAITSFDIGDERQKAYMLLCAGSAMRRFLNSIYCEYGILLNDESMKVYEDLRNYIVFLNDSLDADLQSENDLHLGIYIETCFPEKLNDIDRGGNEDGEGDKTEDFINNLNWYEKKIIKFTGNVIFDIFLDLQEILTETEKTIIKNNEVKVNYLASMKRNVDESIYAISISSIIEDLDFSYVEQVNLREILKDYLKEAVKAFQHDLFRTTVIFSRSIVEALFVYALEYIGSDARIDYATKYENRSKSYRWKEQVQNIARWDIGDLIDIAFKNGIIRTKYLDKYCFNINQYRNTIHIYKQLISPLTIDFRVAHLSLITLSFLSNDLEYWFLECGDKK